MSPLTSPALRFLPRLAAALLLAATILPGASALAQSADFARCLRMNKAWTRYETAYCPNQSGQRAQAEWALWRCQLGDARGPAELTRLLRRDLIPLP